MSHIFISYSRNDIDDAQKIVEALAKNKLDTWVDWKSIPKGEDWEQEIYRGIEEADAFLFLISTDSVISEPCNLEIAHAVKNGKRILPVFITNVDDKEVYSVTEKFIYKESKEEINRRNYIFCREEKDEFEKAVDEIQTTIHTDYEWLKYHTRLQTQALAWERREDPKDTSRLLRGKELREAEEQFTRIGNLKEPQPTVLQRNYILSSQRSEVHTRRQVTIGLVTGLGIMIVLALVAWGQRNEAKSQQATAQAASTQAIAQESIAKTNEAEAKRQTNIATSRQYATLAWYYMIDRYDLSALFGVEAIQIAQIEEAFTVLQNGLEQHVNLRYLPGPIKQVTIMNFSVDGELFAAASCDRDLNESKEICGESKIWVWETLSRQQIGTPISVSGKVNILFFSPDGNTLIAGVCNQHQGANYCTQEVWAWDIQSHRSTNVPLLISERYPIHIDVNDNNLLAIASCRRQQEIVDGFRCLQSEISFYDLESEKFIYNPLEFEEVLGPIAFTTNDLLVLSRCTILNEIGNGCFGSEVQIMNVRTSAIIHGPYSLGIYYPLDILPTYFNEIYISSCHESEDLGPCAQPLIWRWDAEYDEPSSYWRPDIMPVSLSIGDPELLVISQNAIETQELEEARNYLLLDFAPDKFSGMIFNPVMAIAAVFHKDGEILLINLGWDSMFENLTVNGDFNKQDLIKSACEIAGRNFTQAEWQQYFPEQDYRITCPQWPAGE